MPEYRFVEHLEDRQVAYRANLVDAKKLCTMGSDLSLKIVDELSRQPGCAMDIARKLQQHEQKIYYHLRRLEAAGIVEQVRAEKRFGMTAKIFALVSPVIASKLSEEGKVTTTGSAVRDPKVESFLSPFVQAGKLNSIIIMGDPYPHGAYEASAQHGVHITDFALLLGRYLNTQNLINYKLDTQASDADLRGNIILIGCPKVNTITDKINQHLPLYFDKEKEWAIVSRLTKSVYGGDHDAVIVRMKNPFNKKAELLMLGGKRSMGLRAAVLACVNHSDEIMKGNSKDKSVIARVVTGIDKDGDGIVDSVRFLE